MGWVGEGQTGGAHPQTGRRSLCKLGETLLLGGGTGGSQWLQRPNWEDLKCPGGGGWGSPDPPPPPPGLHVIVDLTPTTEGGVPAWPQPMTPQFNQSVKVQGELGGLWGGVTMGQGGGG